MGEDLLRDLDAVRGATLRRVAALSQRQLDFSPRTGRWSIGEVLDHVLRTQRIYADELAELVALKRAGRRPYLRRTFGDLNISPLFLPDAVLPWFDLPLSIANRIVPDAVRDVLTAVPILPSRSSDRGVPQQGRAGIELRHELRVSLADLHALVDGNRDLDLDELVFEHPATGVSPVPRMLAFLAQHERRHQRQIDAVRDDRRFPSPGPRA